MRPLAALPVAAWALLLLTGCAVALKCPALCRCSPPDGTRVDCTFKSLSGIPEGLDPNVTFLDLSGNNIRTVHPERLAGLSRLAWLDLSNNYISLLSPSAFSALGALEALDLSGNRITRLAHVAADTLLANLTRLNSLSLAGNQLQELQESDGRLVLASPSLRTLDLSGCRLQKLDHRTTLARLPRLELLNISANPVKWIRDLESSSLHTLDASRCELDSLGGSSVRGLTALVSLRVSFNRQLRLGEPRLYSATLRSLLAEHCALDTPALDGAPALQYVFLRGNKLEQLRERHFNNSAQVTRLDLQRNLIRFIEKDAFRPLVELERLDLSGNKLHNVAWNAFVNCKKLKSLYLSDNPLTELANISSDSILRIDASQCKISALGREVFAGVRYLQEANLSSNWIESVPQRLRSVSLTKLDLSQCRLTAVTNETFAELYKLQRLYLHGNRLTNVPKSSMVTSMRSLMYLTLHDNPWRCDCGEVDFRYLWDNMTVTSPPILTVRERQMVKCASPERVSGQQWWIACVDTWYPPSQTQTGSSASRNGAAALGLVAVVITAFALCCFLRQRIANKKEERAEQLDQMARAADDMQERLRRQHSEALLHQELEVIVRTRFSPPSRRTESRLSQPPTYEEALIMARSVEELAERNATAQTTAARRRPSTSSSSSSSSFSDDGGGQYARGAAWSNRPVPRDYQNSGSGSGSDGDRAAASSSYAAARPDDRRDLKRGVDVNSSVSANGSISSLDATAGHSSQHSGGSDDNVAHGGMQTREVRNDGHR